MLYADLVKQVLVDPMGKHQDHKIQGVVNYIIAARGLPASDKRAVRQQVRRVLLALADCKVIIVRPSCAGNGGYQTYRWRQDVK